MGKKSERAQPTSSGVFDTLFGKSGDRVDPLGLFSDNPYRRKSSSTPLSESGEEGNLIDKNSPPTTGQTEVKDSSGSEAVKKRKRRGLEDALTETIDQQNEILKKNKKKRKRDEIEEEYETRKYGGVVGNKEGVEEEAGRKKVGYKKKAAGEAADMVVEKEGFDDESKIQRTIFVGNLPLKVKRKALLKEFKQFGEIESVRIRSVPIVDSKIPRKGAIIKGNINEAVDSVNAYIVYKDEKSVQAALSHNMAKFGDKHIRVDRACPPDSAPLYNNKKTIFVGNLPFDVKDEELYQLFSSINQLEPQIEAIRVIRDASTGIGKGIAYVMFKTRDAANMVVKKGNLKLRDRDVRVYHAKSDNTRSTPAKRRRSISDIRNPLPIKRLAGDARSFHNKSSKPVASAAALSYQGMRSNRPGTLKKVKSKPKINDESKFKFANKRKGGMESIARTNKRPAVVARKAKQKRLAARGMTNGNDTKSDGRAFGQVAKKRKMESRTSGHFHKGKKARHH